MDNSFFESMRQLTDEEFLNLLCRAEHEPVINGITMPGFPDAAFQNASVGSSGGKTLRNEGWRFYKLVKEYAAALSDGINPNTKILDFGCGWGRMIRFYFKDTKSENIFGIDVDPIMVKICQDTLRCGSFSVTTPLPPTDFPDNSLDLIFAYSVFSHLKHDIAEEWIREFSRILAPNGLLVATTQGEGFLDYCKQLRENPEQQTLYWHKLIAKCFDPVEEYYERYRNGEFLYAATGGNSGKEGVRDASFYGEAIVPKAYIEKCFGKYLQFRDFFYDIKRLSQACFVMQKK